ncbi:hypothetical protein [Burkholderia sp. BCC1988]|uniref:hypothetical protein n=1 Tax=Burkholderia sp. BCC1988 TaxID=2817443 RepID=UPI002AB0E5B0|nr:hypothetical protein [Burkholderia sp. BCC1988]
MRGRVAPVGFVRFYRTVYGLAGALAVPPVVIGAHFAFTRRVGHPADARQAAAAGNIDAQAACPTRFGAARLRHPCHQAFRTQESP